MKKAVLALVVSLLSPAVARAATIVPGTSNMWLAGMPAGTTAGLEDVAPGQSPVLVSGLTLTPGMILTFSATGLVSNGPCCALVGPDGTSLTDGVGAPENGIADVLAPVNALMGVFLDATQPNLTPTPASLDFSGAGLGLNFTSLAPGLKQVFFIGNGLTSGNMVQQFTVPTGATRLFLGTMDGFGWNNNLGSFTVEIADAAAVPEPASLVLVGLGLAAVALRGARQRRGSGSRR